VGQFPYFKGVYSDLDFSKVHFSVIFNKKVNKSFHIALLLEKLILSLPSQNLWGYIILQK